LASYAVGIGQLVKKLQQLHEVTQILIDIEILISLKNDIKRKIRATANLSTPHLVPNHTLWINFSSGPKWTSLTSF
jgi:hypothetical protein